MRLLIGAGTPKEVNGLVGVGCFTILRQQRASASFFPSPTRLTPRLPVGNRALVRSCQNRASLIRRNRLQPTAPPEPGGLIHTANTILESAIVTQ